MAHHASRSAAAGMLRTLIAIVPAASAGVGCCFQIDPEVTTFSAAESAPGAILLEPPLVTQLRGGETSYPSFPGPPLPPVTFTIEKGEYSDLYLGRYDDGQFAAALRWGGWAPGGGRGYIGRLMTWYPGGEVRSIHIALGLNLYGHTWDPQGRLIAATPMIFHKPWNPDPFAHPPPPPETVDQMLEEVLKDPEPLPPPVVRPSNTNHDRWYR